MNTTVTPNYSWGLSVAKGIIPLLISGGILTTGQVADLEAAANLAVPVVLALWYSLSNWSKRSPDGFGDPLGWLKRLFVPLVLCTLILGGAGCATNGLTISETTPDGGTFALEMKQQSMPWARVEDGSNNMSYSGPDWHLGAGNAAASTQGGDLTEVMGRMMEMMLAGFIGNLNAPRPPDTPGLLEQVMANPEALRILRDMILRSEIIVP